MALNFRNEVEALIEVVCKADLDNRALHRSACSRSITEEAKQTLGDEHDLMFPLWMLRYAITSLDFQPQHYVTMNCILMLAIESVPEQAATQMVHGHVEQVCSVVSELKPGESGRVSASIVAAIRKFTEKCTLNQTADAAAAALDSVMAAHLQLLPEPDGDQENPYWHYKQMVHADCSPEDLRCYLAEISDAQIHGYVNGKDWVVINTAMYHGRAGLVRVILEHMLTLAGGNPGFIASVLSKQNNLGFCAYSPTAQYSNTHNKMDADALHKLGKIYSRGDAAVVQASLGCQVREVAEYAGGRDRDVQDAVSVIRSPARSPSRKGGLFSSRSRADGRHGVGGLARHGAVKAPCSGVAFGAAGKGLVDDVSRHGQGVMQPESELVDTTEHPYWCCKQELLRHGGCSGQIKMLPASSRSALPWSGLHADHQGAKDMHCFYNKSKWILVNSAVKLGTGNIRFANAVLRHLLASVAGDDGFVKTVLGYKNDRGFCAYDPINHGHSNVHGRLGLINIDNDILYKMNEIYQGCDAAVVGELGNRHRQRPRDAKRGRYSEFALSPGRQAKRHRADAAANSEANQKAAEDLLAWVASSGSGLASEGASSGSPEAAAARTPGLSARR